MVRLPILLPFSDRADPIPILSSGRFLYDVLGDLAKWYKDEKAYKTEAIGDNLRGFARYFAPLHSTNSGHYTHAEVKKAINKWHAAMLRVSRFFSQFIAGETDHFDSHFRVSKIRSNRENTCTSRTRSLFSRRLLLTSLLSTPMEDTFRTASKNLSLLKNERISRFWLKGESCYD